MYDLSKLLVPFPVEEVSWRAGVTSQDKKSCLPLAYIDARNVMDRLDEVFTPARWQTMYGDAPGGGVLCGISVWFGPDVGWITKFDGADQTQFEAVKGGLSDAFKRAAVHWGIGRYLYGLKSPWVPCEQRGNSMIITKEGQAQLNEFYRKAVGSITVAVPTQKDLISYGKSLGLSIEEIKAALAAYGDYSPALHEDMKAVLKKSSAEKETKDLKT